MIKCFLLVLNYQDENILALWLSPAPEPTMADDMEQADDEPIFICSSSQKGDVTDLLVRDFEQIFEGLIMKFRDGILLNKV